MDTTSKSKPVIGLKLKDFGGNFKILQIYFVDKTVEQFFFSSQIFTTGVLHCEGIGSSNFTLKALVGEKLLFIPV